MNKTKILYTIDKTWMYTAIIFFFAVAMFILDVRYTPGILSTGLIASIFIFVFSKDPNIETYKKYDSIKAITNNMFPLTSDIRILVSVLLSVIVLFILFMFLSVMPDKYVNMYQFDVIIIDILALILFFLYSIIVIAAYEVLLQLRNLDLSNSPYKNTHYKIKHIEYMKINMLVLFISCCIIAYRVYQAKEVIENGKQIFFYY